MHDALRIPTKPGLIQQDDGVNFRTDAPMPVYMPGRNMVVPRGFKTDLASIPPLGVVGAIVMTISLIICYLPILRIIPSVPLWACWFSVGTALIGFGICMASAYLKPYGRYTYAAVLHDWLYRTHCVSFTVANWYLLLAMRQEKTARWERLLIWFNVQMFGWIFYYSVKRQAAHHLDQHFGHQEERGHYGGKHHRSHQG